MTMTVYDFKETSAYRIIKDFIFRVDNSIKTEPQMPARDNDVVFEAKEIIERTPLSNTRGRYANPAMGNVISEIEKISGSPYFSNAFGNKLRMDFGTGHELSYLCYLYTRHKEGKLQINEVLGTLREYFEIVRMHIRKFNIEAAGSRGCWSVDDYLLLPYLFGSSENFGKTQSIDEIDSGVFKDAYMANDSAMLKNICRLPWTRINVGMMRMYDEEVLGKSVVTQHFVYTDDLPIN